MPAELTLVFIDGGYLSKISKQFGHGKHLQLDLIKFAHFLAQQQKMICEQAFYYTAPPFLDTPPTIEEMEMKNGYDRFMSKLKSHAGMTVREGRLQRIGSKYTQKGVDTLLTMDLVLEPVERKIQTIILLAADTDFVPVLNRLRTKHGVKVILYYYSDFQRKSLFSMSNYLPTACDVKILLNEKDLLKNTMQPQ